MEKAKYKFYFVNGQIEELETQYEYTDDANGDLRVKLTHNPTWLYVGGKHINLSNVISIEVVGENDKIRLKPIKLAEKE